MARGALGAVAARRGARRPAPVTRFWSTGATRSARCQLLTVIITTSPISTHPSTAMLEEVVGSFALVPGLRSCPTVVVFDGYKVKDQPRYRSGHVTADGAERYREYVRRVLRLGLGAPLVLAERMGFGFALRAGLREVRARARAVLARSSTPSRGSRLSLSLSPLARKVRTPFVLVVQHDRNFVRRVDARAIVAAMCRHRAWLQYAGLPTGVSGMKLRPSRSGTRACRRARRSTARAAVLSRYALRLEHVATDEGLRLMPLVQWYDSTHVCATAHYRRFVYGPRAAAGSSRRAGSSRPSSARSSSAR